MPYSKALFKRSYFKQCVPILHISLLLQIFLIPLFSLYPNFDFYYLFYFSDMEHGSPYDDDCDGKLVIAEHDDLDDDLKPDELGMLGGLLGKDGKKPRRKHSRFNGLPEDEVMKRLLPDLICPNLDILIVSTFF